MKGKFPLCGNFKFNQKRKCEHSVLGVPSSPSAEGASPRRSHRVITANSMFSLHWFYKIWNLPWQISTLTFRFSGIFHSREAWISLLQSKNFTFRRRRNISRKASALPLRLLLGEAPAAAGDEGTPRKLCSHLSFNKIFFASAKNYLNFARRAKHHLREAQSSLWRKPNHHVSPQEKLITLPKWWGDTENALFALAC